MTLLAYFASAAIGYALGCVNLAHWIARRRGFDIRSVGTKNAGASNVVATVGLYQGVKVALIDMLKATLAVFAARWLFPTAACADVVAGVGCVAGHVFPPHLRFRGGKGFAPYLGMMLALYWPAFVVSLAALVVIAFTCRYSVIGTFVAVVGFPIALVFRGFPPFTDCAAAAASLLVLYRHKDNIRRILRGEEQGLQALIRKKRGKM